MLDKGFAPGANYRSMHPLEKYLQDEKLTATEFAARIDRSVSTVTRAMRGSVPDPTTLEKIVAATNGKVQPNDFYPFSKPCNGGALDQGAA